NGKRFGTIYGHAFRFRGLKRNTTHTFTVRAVGKDGGLGVAGSVKGKTEKELLATRTARSADPPTAVRASSCLAPDPGDTASRLRVGHDPSFPPLLGNGKSLAEGIDS